MSVLSTLSGFKKPSVDNKSLQAVVFPRLMNLNGPSQTITHSAASALTGTILPTEASKVAAPFSWSHPIIWVNQEQRERR